MTGTRPAISPSIGSDEPASPGAVRSDDPLVDMVVRVHTDFGGQIPLAEILAVIDRCRTDLDAPNAAAQATLVERLVRQHLADLAGDGGAGGANAGRGQRDVLPTRRLPDPKP